MNKISASKKILGVLLLLNIVAVAGCFFMFYIISETNGKISAMTSEVDFYLEQEETVSSLDSLLKDVSLQAEKMTSYFVSSDGIVDFIEEVENLASENDLSFDVSSVEISPGSDDFVETLIVKVDARGSWEDMYYFLAALEYLPFKLNIKTINLMEIQPSLRTEVSSEDGNSVVVEGGLWRAVFDIEVLKFK